MLRPQGAPGYDIAVGHIEGLVAARRRHRHEFHRAREQRRVGEVALRVEGGGRAGKIERKSKLTAKRRIGADHRDGIAGALRREIVDEGRARGRPGPRFPARALGEQVLLVVVEIRKVRTRVVLARRRAERPEVHAVIFRALHQMNVLEAARDRLDCVDADCATSRRCRARSRRRFRRASRAPCRRCASPRSAPRAPGGSHPDRTGRLRSSRGDPRCGAACARGR